MSIVILGIAATVIVVLQIVCVILLSSVLKKVSSKSDASTAHAGAPLSRDTRRSQPVSQNPVRSATSRPAERPQHAPRPAPQAPAPAVTDPIDQSLRDINMRLKNAEHDQELARRQMGSSAAPRSDRAPRPERGERRPGSAGGNSGRDRNDRFDRRDRRPMGGSAPRPENGDSSVDVKPATTVQISDPLENTPEVHHGRFSGASRPSEEVTSNNFSETTPAKIDSAPAEQSSAPAFSEAATPASPAELSGSAPQQETPQQPLPPLSFGRRR